MEVEKYDEIYLIVMDAVSAESTPFASDFDNMPFLLEKSRNGFIATNCYSSSPWTVPSHASIFSGLDPNEHGVSTANKFFDKKSFVEDLSNRGFETNCFSANPLVSEDLGFDKGFENIIVGDDLKFEANNLSFLQDKDLSGKKRYLFSLKELVKNFSFSSARGAFNLLRKRSSSHDLKSKYIVNLVTKNQTTEEKQFFYLNLMDAHAPYNVPDKFFDPTSYQKDIREKVSDKFLTDGFRWTEEFDAFEISEVQKLYRDSIEYLDDMIKTLYSCVEDEDKKQLFIVTSDHGELIKHDDMDIWAHQLGIWKRTVHVPLVIFGDDVDKMEKNDLIGLKEIKDLLTTDKELDELGSNSIEMSYKGLYQMREEFDNLSEQERKLFRNSSKGLAMSEKLYVENSQIEDEEWDL
jgi:arylsulfatase A-like enzyme